MPIVDCKLTDCSKHGLDICVAIRIGIDGVGQVECYDPVEKSEIVHDYARAEVERRNGRITQSHRRVFK